MYDTVIFIDLENISKIDDLYLSSHTKIYIMVGKGQEKLSLDLLMEKYNKVEAIELIKVNGSGYNALDFFIAFYLGKYYTDFKDAKIIIYTKDGGYEPLKSHLLEKDINIIRINNEALKTNKNSKSKNLDSNDGNNINDINKKYNEVRQHFHPVNKHPRPRSLKTLRQYFQKDLKKNKYNKEDIEEIIKLMIKNKIINISDKKTEKIKWLI
jgi:mevalonate kinase